MTKIETMVAPEFRPLTPERWSDFERLFGANGACGGCWCMLWRLARKDFERHKGDGNRERMKALVCSGLAPGILGYLHDDPAAWCSVAPREAFPALARSRILQPIDNRPVWSISCFFVAKAFRGRGLLQRTLQAAVDFAIENGATLIEGYPVEPKTRPMPAAFAWVGFASAFRAVGFKECERRSETRPMMRYEVLARKR